MDCKEFCAQLEELAIDRPDFELTPTQQQHARECPACEGEYVSFREVWMMLPAALETPAIRADFEESVMSRLEFAPQVFKSDDDVSGSDGIWKYVLAASVLLALVGLTLSSSSWMGKDKAQYDPRDLARQLGKLAELEETFASPELRYVSLTSADAAQRVQGYLVYDLVGMEGHFFGYGMAHSDEWSYVLWLLDDEGAVVSSAVIDVNDDNLGAVTIPLPSDIFRLKEVVVSQEGIADSTTPSSNLKMRTKVKL